MPDTLTFADTFGGLFGELVLGAGLIVLVLVVAIGAAVGASHPDDGGLFHE